MKKPVMFYCGIVLTIISFIGLVQTANPSAISYYFGGIFAGIILAIIGGRKKANKSKVA